MTGRLIVSPHLDDAVLSCWHALTAGSEPATVVTLFAGVPDAGAKLARWDSVTGANNPAGQMLRRRMEDEAALTSFGARFVHCDFLDDQYRGWVRPRRALVDRLKELAQDAAEVWLPAGIGAHPDHVLAAEVALAATVGRRRVLYADLPYAARGLVGIHGGDHRSSTGPGKLREKVRAALVASPHVPHTAPTSYHLSGPEQIAKRRCLEQYQTQQLALTMAHPEWWQNPEVFEWEWWWPLDVGRSSGRPHKSALPRIRSGWGHWWACRLRRRLGHCSARRG